jgi:hypothetical protein
MEIGADVAAGDELLRDALIESRRRGGDVAHESEGSVENMLNL